MSGCNKVPASTETAEFKGQQFEVVREGKAAVLFKKGEVFYNNVQVQNRDLSVASLRVFRHIRQEEETAKAAKKGQAKELEENNDGFRLRVVEALAASGLRSVRFVKEVEGISSIIVNDLDKAAIESIERNAEFNKLPKEVVKATNEDATLLLHDLRRERDKYNVIDLDPYGSPSIFLDGAVQAVDEGGLLCITATDLAVLCGNHPEVCFTRYGATPLRGKHCHEFALRILLHSIQSTAAKYKRKIEPLLSVNMDFYIRVFVRVRTSAAGVKDSPLLASRVYQCTGCGTFELEPVAKFGNSKYTPATGPKVGQSCPQCGGKWHVRENTGGFNCTREFNASLRLVALSTMGTSTLLHSWTECSRNLTKRRSFSRTSA